MKHRIFKRLVTVLLLLCFITAFLAGCEQEKALSTPDSASSDGKSVTLRIAVEDSSIGMSDDAFISYLKELKRDFSLNHENVEIFIERIPREDGREEVLQRLRTELMIGEGPDILVLPVLPASYMYLSEYMEPLIPDVQLGMHNGLFLDIGAYYDADTELD